MKKATTIGLIALAGTLTIIVMAFANSLPDTSPPTIPTGLRYTTTTGTPIACGSVVNMKRVPVIAKWDPATDTGSGVNHYEYVSFNPPGGWAWPSTTTGQITYNTEYGDLTFIPNEGGYGFMVRAVDNTGNKSDWSAHSLTIADSCRITFDFTTPTIAFLGFRNQTSTGYNSSFPIKTCGSFSTSSFIAWEWQLTNSEAWPVVFHYEVTSGTSGVGFNLDTLNTYFYGSIPAFGTYIVKVTAKDTAGNTSTPAICSVNYQPEQNIVGPPTNKDQCKKDGWKLFNNPKFKNQGQCVSYTNSLNKKR